LEQSPLWIDFCFPYWNDANCMPFSDMYQWCFMIYGRCQPTISVSVVLIVCPP
jgi:hypothetical protein